MDISRGDVVQEVSMEVDWEWDGREVSSISSEPQDTSFLRTCINCINALLGIGLLSMPYALSQGGWLCIIALYVISIVTFYTGCLIKRCMESDPTIKTYPDIGQYAFGHIGRKLVSTIIYLELYLVAVEFLILEGDSFEKLFPHFNIKLFGSIKTDTKTTFILLSALSILPTTWLRSLNLLAYISLGGVVSSFILVGSVVWVGAVEGEGFKQNGIIWSWSGVVTAMSLFSFCFGGHPVFPTMYSSMKDRKKFSKVLVICFTCSTFMYGLMAILGYKMYGQKSMSQITLNLPTSHVSSKIAIVTTILTHMTKYALIIFPVAKAIEDKVDNTNYWKSLIIRTIIVSSTTLIAIFLPYFGSMMSLIGALLNVAVSIWFPCVCYRKIKNGLKQGLEFYLILAILALGGCVMVTGTYISITSIVNNVTK